MDHQEEQQFYKLLRLSLGLTQEFPVEVDADDGSGRSRGQAPDLFSEKIKDLSP